LWGRLVLKRQTALEAEIYGICIAIVPPASDTGVASHLIIADHLNLSANKLLLLAKVWYRILAKIVRSIDKQRTFRREVYTIESTSV
jgi:hypothetical protein